jgi:hypothetical protein
MSNGETAAEQRVTSPSSRSIKIKWEKRRKDRIKRQIRREKAVKKNGLERW